MTTQHTDRSIVRARPSRARALAWSGALLAGLIALPVVAGRTVPVRAALPVAAVSCPGPTYTVQSGDFWVRIASRNNVTLTALLAVNKATKTTVIHPGQVICLPVGTATTSATTTPTTSAPAKAGSCPGPTYTVLSGDSWIRIASQHKLTLTALLAANNATKTTAIHPRQVLCLPVGTPTTAAPTPGSTSVPVAGGPVAIKQFPVQGLCWFSDSWGAPRAGGRKHEGVDIIAAQGQKVYAVDDGVLTKQYIDGPGLLSGNGWRLTRADGTYYFYGHFSGFAPGLKVGSPVVAGQIIGYIGKTGAAGTPHLHFEVHPGGGAAVNPTPIVKAINGCKVTAVPPQPDASTATTLATTTTAPGTATTPPTTTSSPTTSAVPTTVARVANGLWQFIAPVVVLDTGATPLTAATPRPVPVAGQQGIAADVPGVMVRVVVSNPALSGFLTLHPCDAAWRTTSSLNFGPDRSNSVVTFVPVNAGGFCVSSNVAAPVRLEVVAVQSSTGVGVIPVDSRRALDTRSSAPLVAGSTATVGLSQLNAPAGSKAVTVTVTLLDAAAAGTLAIGPCNGSLWPISFAAARTQSFSSVARIDEGGLCLKSSVQVQAIVDVTGVWSGDQPMTSIAPRRLLDTRASAPLSPTTRRFSVGADGRTRAQLSVVLIGAPTGGAVYAWNCSRPRPVASVGYTQGPTTTVTVTMDVTGGEVCLSSSGAVHAVIDLVAVG